MSVLSHMAPGSFLTPLCIPDESALFLVVQLTAPHPLVPLVSRPPTGIALILLSVNEDRSSNGIDRRWSHCTPSPPGIRKEETHTGERTQAGVELSTSANFSAHVHTRRVRRKKLQIKAPAAAKPEGSCVFCTFLKMCKTNSHFS